MSCLLRAGPQSIIIAFTLPKILFACVCVCGLFLVLFQFACLPKSQGKKKPLRLFFSPHIIHLSQKWRRKKKTVAFKHHQFANDSFHPMTVLRRIRCSKHPARRRRPIQQPPLRLRSLHMFSNIISCLLSDSSLNKGLWVPILPVSLLRQEHIYGLCRLLAAGAFSCPWPACQLLAYQSPPKGDILLICLGRDGPQGDPQRQAAP